jgi:hypothetical protein
LCLSCSLAGILHKTAAPASKSTAIANHALCSPTLPALGVPVADAVPVFDAVVPPALFPEADAGVVDVPIVLAADVTGGSEVIDSGPGPRAERPLVAFEARIDAGKVASADAVSGMSKI